MFDSIFRQIFSVQSDYIIRTWNNLFGIKQHNQRAQSISAWNSSNIDKTDHWIPCIIVGTSPEPTVPTMVWQLNFDCCCSEWISWRPKLNIEFSNILSPWIFLGHPGIFNVPFLRSGIIIVKWGIQGSIVVFIYNRVVNIHRIISADCTCGLDRVSAWQCGDQSYGKSISGTCR